MQTVNTTNLQAGKPPLPQSLLDYQSLVRDFEDDVSALAWRWFQTHGRGLVRLEERGETVSASYLPLMHLELAGYSETALVFCRNYCPKNQAVVWSFIDRYGWAQFEKITPKLPPEIAYEAMRICGCDRCRVLSGEEKAKILS